MNEILRTEGPDYNNCLVNLANSILKRFGAETLAGTLGLADRYLEGKHKNTVLLLLDAMGVSILEKHLEEDGFFRSHVAGTYTSVYPPTTVAATTSVLSGMYPNEHGWLGWDIYFPQLDKNVTVYRNTEQMKEREGAAPVTVDGKTEWTPDSLEEGQSAAEFNAGYTYIPYKNILDRINEAGGKAYASMPFLPPYPATFDDVLARVKELCEEPGEKFIYAYWNEPDSTMHRTGTTSEKSHNMITEIEEKVKALAERLSDTLLIITADHSHMDGENLCILDYPEVTDCLVRMPSIEPRTLNLFVKEECREAFPEIFRRNFGDGFLLLTREEVLSEKLFGPGEDLPGLSGMIGDYVALATTARSIFNTHYEAQVMPGGHAGLTAEECRIPLIIAGSARSSAPGTMR